MDDPYEAGAPFYDLFMVSAWNDLAVRLRAVLASCKPERGPIVDIGAGTGLGTVVAAEALPDAELVAIEPSASLRIALFSRLASRPEVLARVSVVPMRVEDAALPRTLGGAMCLHALGHFGPEARRALWRRLARHLAPGAPAIVTVDEQGIARVVARSRACCVEIGRETYELYASAEPWSEHEMRWLLEYRILADGEIRSKQLVAFDTFVAKAWEISEEAAAEGLKAEQVEATLLTLRSSRS